MARLNDHLAAVLMDVSINGAVVIDKRKLLWLMGKAQDRPSAWAELLTHWEDMGMRRQDLLGSQVFDNVIVLMRGPDVELQTVDDWAS